MQILVNGSGGFIVRLYIPTLPTKLSVSSNTSISWSLSGNWLTVTGTLHSTSSINVTDFYKLRIEAYDAFGNRMPVWSFTTINATNYGNNIVEVYLNPAIYNITLPNIIKGFKFKTFQDGVTSASRVVGLSSDTTFKAYYKVPVSFRASANASVSPLSSILRLLQLSPTTPIFIEGKVYDYYGNGVPNKKITLNLSDNYGNWMIFDLTTDVSGYFRTQDLQLAPQTTYYVKISAGEDDYYVGNSTTFTFAVESITPAPSTVPSGIPYAYIIAGVVAVLIIAGMVISLKRAKHVIEEESEKRHKFIKKKRFVKEVRENE